MLNKVARHRDCLGVRDPIQQKKKKRQTPRVSMRGVRQIQRLPEHIINDGQRQIDIVRHPIDAAAEKNQEK